MSYVDDLCSDTYFENTRVIRTQISSRSERQTRPGTFQLIHSFDKVMFLAKEANSMINVFKISFVKIMKMLFNLEK